MKVKTKTNSSFAVKVTERRLILEPGPRPWTRTLDSDPENPGPRKTWTLEKMDPEKPGP